MSDDGNDAAGVPGVPGSPGAPGVSRNDAAGASGASGAPLRIGAGIDVAVVTGAGGFLGTRVVERLLGEGARVRAIAAPGEQVPARDGVEVTVADISVPGALDEACTGADVVFHLAAIYQFGPADPDRMWRVNVEGTEHVLASAARAGAVAVHVSSASALGRTTAAPEDETYWAPQVEPIHYELTKREGHLRALLASARGARVRIAAPAALYGAGDPSITGTLIELLRARTLPVFGPADVMQCPVHVEDCADALVRIATRGRDGELYCIGGEPISMGEMVGLVCSLAGRPRPRPVKAATIRRLVPVLSALAPLGGTSRWAAREMLTVGCASYCYSNAKAVRELDWHPRPLRDGLAAG